MCLVLCEEDPSVIVEPWVSVQKIAAHLRVTKDSVYCGIDKKGPPAHKMGRLWKFKISQVDAWVEAGGGAKPTSSANAEDKPRT